MPLGEAAALAAALIWAATSLFYARAGRLISPVAANTYKCTAALLLLTIAQLILHRSPFPSASSRDWLILVVSGVIGLAIGDSCLFSSFVRIGARKGLLLLSLNPLIGTVLGWIILHEALDGRSLAGIAITLVGIGVVLAPGRSGDGASPLSIGRHALLVGALFGLAAALCQATGALLAKPVLARIDSLGVTQMRMVGGAVTLILLGFARGRYGLWFARMRAHSLFGPLLVASFFGQFVAVWLMTVSLDLAPAGVALTILSTAPIWLVLFGGSFEGDRPTARERAGFFIAIAGVALLLIR